ncbi:MAG: C39 family peptidase [candidate division WOR-3 bacterium]
MILPIKPISQRDLKWKDKKLGTSTVNTIGSHGCLLTCCAMVCNYFGKNTDPARLNDDMVRVKGFYSGSLWVWGKLSEVYPDILFDWQVYNEGQCADKPAPLSLIDRLLDEKLPVIVKVDFNPGGALDEHWVLIIGKDEAGSYLINDPWTGETYFFQAKYQDPARYIYQICAYRGKIPEEKYQLLKGGVLLKEYETNPEDKILDLENKVSSLNEELAKTRLEVNSLREALSAQETDNKDLASQLQTARQERDNALILANQRLLLLEKASKMINMSSFDENGLFTGLQGLVEAKNKVENLEETIKTRENEIERLKEEIKKLEKQKIEDFSGWELVLKGILKIVRG